MKISPNTKFTLINTLFFGIIGSLLGGIIPALIGAVTVHEPSAYQMITDDGMFEATRMIFIEYVLLSLMIGFIPASISGYLYSESYKKEFLSVGAVDFWKELKFGAIASLKAVLACYLPITVLALAAVLSGSATKNDGIFMVLFMLFGSWLVLSFLGVMSGMACSNLIREWNQKLAKQLSN